MYYIEHSNSHWTDNLYVHKTKDYDMTQVKRKRSRPTKQKTKPDSTQMPAAIQVLYELSQCIKFQN